MVSGFQQFWRNWRRRRHLVRGQALARKQGRGPLALLGALAALGFVLGGMALLVAHAQRLPELLPQAKSRIALPQWQAALPGWRFEVGQEPVGGLLQAGPEGRLWHLAGMQAATPVHIDLCQQKADAKRWLPIYVGWQFDKVQQAVQHNRQKGLPDGFGLKGLVLSDEAGPQLVLQASAAADALAGQGAEPLWQVRQDAGGPVRLLSDVSPGALQTLTPGAAQAWRREAWFSWQQEQGKNGNKEQRGQARALHVAQRASRGCPHGQLRLQWYRAASAAEPVSAAQRVLVQPFTWQQGALPALWLGAGQYQVPAANGPVLEDQQLFERLLAAGLLRQQGGAAIELAPRDWASAAAAGNWPDPAKIGEDKLEAGKRLVRRLYSAADGSYVRQQVAVFNRELAQPPAGGDLAYRHIRQVAGKLQWHVIKSGPAQAVSRAQVTIVDRQQQLLWANGRITPAAEQAGLATLLAGADGEGREGSSGLAAQLARVPGAAHSATLTLDVKLQALAQKIVACSAHAGAKWQAGIGGQDGQCQGGSGLVPQRRAALLLQDAETGEILAASLHHPAARPMLPWQHDGSNDASPGSTFKLVTALALEQVAEQRPALQALLAGLSPGQINTQAAQLGHAYRSDAACYPTPCDGKQPHVTNYHDQLPQNKLEAGRFGLVQALGASINTWFAFAAEQTDASLFGQPQGGLPDLHGLQDETLDALRPVLQVARQLGFERSLRLDGGLLPGSLGGAQANVLQTQPARITVPHSRHETRQIALGLRMQSHVLQMAQVAGAIGQGQVVTPRLLARLDSQDARPEAGPALTMRLDRVRTGMAQVVSHGTASSAFADPALAALRPFLYGKTGTAPVGQSHNSAWFAGYLEPGSLPGQTRRWAFSAWVSHTDLTGGAQAAPMVAALLTALAQGAVK